MSTSSGFPLLQLPLLALETCVNMMNPDTVLELARHSKQFKSRLSIVKYKIESVEWRMSNYRTGVILKSKVAVWDFRIESPTMFSHILRQRGIQVESLNLNETTVSLATRVGSGRIDFWLMDFDDSSESKIDTLKNLTKFLMSFVRCSKFKLEYSLKRHFLSQDFFVHQYLNGNLIDLKVYSNGNPLIMTPDVIKFILENVKFGQLWLNIRVSEPNFKYQGYLEAKELTIPRDNSWIDLRNINCQKIVFHKNAESIYETLKNWTQGSSMEKLEFFEIHTQKNLNPDEHLKDLKHQNTRFSREDIRKRIWCMSDKYVFRDIQRESDGRWGTLCKTLWSFYFIVWTPEKLKECCQETRIKLGLE